MRMSRHAHLPASAATRRHQVLVVLVAAERAGYFRGAATKEQAVRLAEELLGEEFADMQVQAQLSVIWAPGKVGGENYPLLPCVRWSFVVNGSTLEEFDE
jgi:hypothetical protein